MKSILLFFVMFLVGAVIALGFRTVAHDPHAQPAPAAPSAGMPAPAVSAPVADLHGAHSAATTAKTVNTVCAVCGMEVDPDIQPASYQGKLVGFGCAACPAKFAGEPERYGPASLRNEIASN